MPIAPIAGPELLENDPAIRARINAAYPTPLYHVDEILPAHRVPDDYLAGFRVPALQEALAETLGPACVAERAAQDLSHPIVDARDRRGHPVSESALALAHDPIRGWHVIATRPISAGDSIGNYWGDFTHYEGPDAHRPSVLRTSARRFLDRVIDSYPGANQLSPAARRALRQQIQSSLCTLGPYSYLISLPVPGAPPIYLIVDSMKRGAITRFMSHGNPPNLSRIFCRDVRAGLYFLRIEFLANRDIAPGEELTFDYGHPESRMQDEHEAMRRVHESITAALDHPPLAR